MKTAVARTWKSLTSKIHPPLPLTPQDSERLLSLLNASFKRQLDREHLAASSSSKHHADLHLQSILTNPLFDAKPRTHATSTSKHQRIGPRLGQLQNHMNNPMDAFKERVSHGTADLEVAKFCLRVQYKACLASEAATPRESMRSSQAASTVLQWLWSSGMEDTGSFLNDSDFVGLFVPFLVAEGRYSQISRWLQRCQESGETPFSSLCGLDTLLRIRRFLFARLVLEEIGIGDGLESAIKMFVRTVADVRGSGWTKKSLRYDTLDAAWLLTTKIVHLPNASKLDPSLIHAFLKTMREMNNPDDLLKAILGVYVQKRPDPQPALILFQHSPDRLTRILTPIRRPYIIFLGLRAAELFLQEGREQEAILIMDFLQTNLAQELGLPAPQARKTYSFDGLGKMVKNEEKSLNLLDTLAVQ